MECSESVIAFSPCLRDISRLCLREAVPGLWFLGRQSFGGGQGSTTRTVFFFVRVLDSAGGPLGRTRGPL